MEKSVHGKEQGLWGRAGKKGAKFPLGNGSPEGLWAGAPQPALSPRGKQGRGCLTGARSGSQVPHPQRSPNPETAEYPRWQSAWVRGRPGERKGRWEGGKCGAERRANPRRGGDPARPLLKTRVPIWMGVGREALEGARAAHTLTCPSPSPLPPGRRAPKHREPRAHTRRAHALPVAPRARARQFQSQPRSFKAGRALLSRHCLRAAAIAAPARKPSPRSHLCPTPSLQKAALRESQALTSAPRPRSCLAQ